MHTCATCAVDDIKNPKAFKGIVKCMSFLCKKYNCGKRFKIEIFSPLLLLQNFNMIFASSSFVWNIMLLDTFFQIRNHYIKASSKNFHTPLIVYQSNFMNMANGNHHPDLSSIYMLYPSNIFLEI